MRLTYKKGLLRLIRSPRLARLVHLALMMHFLIAGSLLAVIFGATTYYLRSDELAEDLLDAVRAESDALQLRIRQLAVEHNLTPAEAARRLLSTPQPTSRLTQTARVVSVKVCHPHRGMTFSWNDISVPLPEEDPCPQPGAEGTPSSGQTGHTVEHRRGQIYVAIRTPIAQSRDAAPEELRTVLALSDAARQRIEREAIDNALLAAVIVLLATAAIYPVALLLVRRVETLSENLLQANLETIQVLGSAIAQRDSDTDAHNYRVTLYAVRLAEALNLKHEAMRRLLKGAFLHDVGKIGIADRILRKPGPLTDDERANMRLHVEHGLDIISRSGWLAEAADVVGCHHERWDGTGYPQGLCGNAIPLTARIFAIADVFDALCSERPYKPAYPAEVSLGMMREQSKGHFDEEIFKVFSGIAPALYARYANRRTEVLRVELNAVLLAVFARPLLRAPREHAARAIAEDAARKMNIDA